jgi:hypothetical protein
MNEQIHRESWPAFFNQFSQESQGRPISMEIVGRELGANVEAKTVPLIAIDFDQRAGAILITTGQGTKTLTHVITAPKTVWVERSDEAKKVMALEVIAEEDNRTILRFEDKEKETYQKKVESQLREWGIKTDELKAIAEKAIAETKAELTKKTTEFQKIIEELNAQQEVAWKKLKELKETREETWKDLRVEAEKVWNDLKGLLDKVASKLKYQKEEYQKKIETKLRESDVRIDELKAKAEKAGAELKVELNKVIKDLLAEKENIQKNLDKLKSVGAEAWIDIKSGIDAALEDLEKAYERARSRFK